MAERYVYSGTLPVGAKNYVVRDADEKLFQNLIEGEFCYVLNSRQTGKSSLCVRTMERLDAENCRCVWLDLSERDVMTATAETWYFDMLRTLVDELYLDELDVQQWWQEQELSAPLNRFQRFMEQEILPRIQDPIVVFIDEIDSVLSLPFGTDDFFTYVRACYNHRATNPLYKQLTFCLMGVVAPNNLIRDEKRTPFNIGCGVNLQGFRLGETEPLQSGFLGRHPDPRQLLAEVLDWTNGQPFLTQRVCSLVDETIAQGTFESVAVLVQENVLENWAAKDDKEHLKTIQQRLLHDDDYKGIRLDLLRRILSKGSIEYTGADEEENLRLTGVAVELENRLVIGNLIYQTIFSAEWLEEQLQLFRPYHQALKRWLLSGRKKNDMLLCGEQLEMALEWSQTKVLTPDDYHFLSASQFSDKESAIALKNQEKQVLEKANSTAKKTIISSVFISIILIIYSIFTGNYFNSKLLKLNQEIVLKEAKTNHSIAKRNLEAGFCLNGLLYVLRAGHTINQIEEINNITLDPNYKDSFYIDFTGLLGCIHEFNHLDSHNDDVRRVVFSDDGKLLASASWDGTSKIWNTENWSEYKTITMPKESELDKESVLDIDFDHTNNILATVGSKGIIRLWNLETGQLLKSWNGHDRSIMDIDYSPDGNRIATASKDGKVIVWDAESGKKILDISAHKKEVKSVSFSPDGRFLASSSRDKSIKVWDTNDGSIIQRLGGHESYVNSVEFSHSGNLLVSASSDNTIIVWRFPSGKVLHRLKKHRMSVMEVAFSPDEKLLASASSDNTVRIWDLSSGATTHVLRGHRNKVMGVRFSPNGRYLASGSEDFGIKLWRLENTTKVRNEILGDHNKDLLPLMQSGCDWIDDFLLRNNFYNYDFCFSYDSGFRSSGTVQ